MTSAGACQYKSDAQHAVLHQLVLKGHHGELQHVHVHELLRRCKLDTWTEQSKRWMATRRCQQQCVLSTDSS